MQDRVPQRRDALNHRDDDLTERGQQALPPRLLVRARRRGDHFRPFGGGDRRLKSFLIDAKVPRWDRDRLPLVDAGRDIVWVAGVRRGAAAPITPRTGTVVELRLVPLA